MTRLALGSFLGCLGAAFAAQLDDARLAIQPPDIVWLESGSSVLGANERDLGYAVRLCRDSRPLVLDSPNPMLDGACSSLRFARELPRRRAWTPGYGIDRTEVTHERWRSCVARGLCAPARLRDDDGRIADPRMPVAGVTWGEAQRFCEVAGGRLPTDDEWEHAARGGLERRRFPWGRQYNDRLANHGRSPRGPDDVDGFLYAAPVGSFPGGASPYGLLDVAGNVWEWTVSPPRGDEIETGGDPSVYRIVRGGSWAQPPEVLRVTHREWLPVESAPSDVGLRCAYSPAGLDRGEPSAILRRP